MTMPEYEEADALVDHEGEEKVHMGRERVQGRETPSCSPTSTPTPGHCHLCVAVMNRTILCLTRYSAQSMEYTSQLISVVAKDRLSCRCFINNDENTLAFHRSTWIIELSDDALRIYRETLPHQQLGRLRFLPPDEEKGLYVPRDDPRFEPFMASLKSALDKCIRATEGGQGGRREGVRGRGIVTRLSDFLSWLFLCR